MKNTVKTKYGYFECYIIPFGWFNATVSFVSYINKILAKKLNEFVIIYLKNILIYINKRNCINSI